MHHAATVQRERDASGAEKDCRGKEMACDGKAVGTNLSMKWLSNYHRHTLELGSEASQ